MSRTFFFMITCIFFLQQTRAQSIAVESRITNFLQGGYDLSVFYFPKGRFSIGLQAAGQELRGVGKESVFYSSGHDQLDVRLSWLAAVRARYHFAPHLEGFYGQLSTGMEQFRIRSAGETHRNNNGFITLGVGYIWHPWGRTGFYVNPMIAGIHAFGRASEKSIHGVSYELKSFFPSPSLAAGWKF